MTTMLCFAASLGAFWLANTLLDTSMLLFAAALVVSIFFMLAGAFSAVTDIQQLRG